MPQLLFLPGLACDGAMWEHQLRAVREPAGSPWASAAVTDVHTRCASLPDMAAQLLREHPGPLVLCGASMGAMLALHVVRAAPDRVRGLALLGSSARADTPELLKLRSDAIVLFEQGRTMEVLQANVMFAFHPANVGRAELVRAYLDMIQRAGPAQLVRQNRAVMAREDSRPYLANITCPVWVACGEADQLTPPERSQEMAQAIPQAEFDLLAGAGHMLTMEQPDRVNERLMRFLARVQAPA